MNANGTNLTLLTNHPATDKMATWSPDGQQIAFVSNRDGNEEIYAMNADGTNVTRLTYNSAVDESPHWSSDGQRIAFLSGRDATSSWDNLREIYMINVDGTREERITFINENISSFSWSADGQKLAFAFGLLGEEQIYIKNIDGFSRTLFTEGFSPNWSPTNEQIAFGLDNQIYLKDLNSEGTTQLTDGDHIIGVPVWSPDGSYVAFNRSINYQLEIFVISVETRQETRLTFSFGDDLITDWQP